MKIDKIVDSIIGIPNSPVKSIIELLVNAVQDYPLRGLDDTDEYSKEVRSLLRVDTFDKKILEQYLESNTTATGEKYWIYGSFIFFN